jgi:ATP-binding cassette subfamily B protein/subfamily B ATP-binding cassette protein MsbA
MLSRLNYDSQSIYAAISGVFIRPWINAVMITVVGLSAWRLDHRLTVVIFITAPALAAMSWYFGPRLRARARAAHDARSNVASFVTQVMHAMPVVQAFTAEQRNLSTFRALSGDAVASVRRSAIVTSVAEGFGQLLSVLGTALVLVIGGSAVVRGELTLGVLLVFIAYAKTLEVQWNALLLTHRNLRAAEGGLDRVMEILEAEDEVPERLHPTRFPAITGASRVVFEQVTFGYDTARAVLMDVALDVEPGETVALVGRTGAGKTTLVSLVSRFVDPWSGQVLIDGVDLRDAPLRAVRDRVSVVGQNPLLLPLTVADNIAYGRPPGSVTRARIEAAAVEALAAEFIEQLPEGYDTVIGEWGATLSGGQRQRLAIARAFLKDAPILILDEPTSALDAESESMIVAAIERLRAQRTVLVIAHRLSTVRHADRIVVLDDGRIVEQGMHEQLLIAHGHYATLHQSNLVGSDA